MLRAIRILGSSSSSSSSRRGSISHSLKKPHEVFSSISRNPMKAAPESSTSHSSAFQIFKGGSVFRALQIGLAHSESIPAEASFSYSSSTSVAVQSAARTGEIKFCQSCGGPTKYEIPDGRDRMRAICAHCGKFTYENPKMVVGCLVQHENKILLCKRKIQPSYGLWTLPSGYMEIGESAAEGAIRETWEEANAEVEVVSPFTQLDTPLIGHVHITFLANLKSPKFSAGPETLDCQLFAFEDIPFDSLAFSSMLVTLKLYVEDRKVGSPKFHYGVINRRPAAAPSDIHAYTLDCHLKS